MLEFVKSKSIKRIVVTDKSEAGKIDFIAAVPEKKNFFGRVTQKADTAHYKIRHSWDIITGDTPEDVLEKYNKNCSEQLALIDGKLYRKPKATIFFDNQQNSYSVHPFDTYELAVAAAKTLADKTDLIAIFE